MVFLNLLYLSFKKSYIEIDLLIKIIFNDIKRDFGSPKNRSKSRYQN